MKLPGRPQTIHKFFKRSTKYLSYFWFIRTIIQKYCVVSLLAIAYVSSVVGVFSTLFLDSHRSSFQESIREAGPINSEAFFFSNEEFSKINWMEDGREFEWGNKLFDVSKIVKTKGGFRIFCVNDSLEENFMAMFDHWKHSSSPLAKTKIFFQPQFCGRIDFDSVEQNRDQAQFIFLSIIYSQPIAQAPSPPPRILS